MSQKKILVAALVTVAAFAAATALVAGHDDGTGSGQRRVRLKAPKPGGPTVNAPPASPFSVREAVEPTPVQIHFPKKREPRAGVLFDVRSGRVLWQLHPGRKLPIASLTKMMTGLIIAERHSPNEKVFISKQATGFAGSGIGLLPQGKKVPLEPLLQGLMMVSGNDAAIALAQHDAGGQDAFVARMNRRARGLGLRCSHFSNASGIRDTGNYSCPLDLATLARLDLADRRLAGIIGAKEARVPFPIKSHHLDLVNINPFLLMDAPGITGVKTGLTTAAGRCYVITKSAGGHEVGVVLLHTPDPYKQVPQLLDAGLAALGA